MKNQTILEDLSTKVSLVIERYTKVKEDNLKLSQELAESQKQVKELNQKISRLQKNEELRDIEIDEIAKKLGKLLS